ncbi:MAG TPA: NAD(P)/FAD-dependent oxidoreductase [Rhodopila sp.]|jgi:2-methyl-3-hydroxypyridine 5-carboxylic acid dioxygenase|nr:NAD(P)/FAD-dependent oxidoreductase [Rhodopila sp.]
MAARRHAEVAGAGFAGLAVATALCQRGWTVRVHEMDAAPRAFGAGIHVWRNGLLALRALGALEALRAGCARPARYETRTNGVRTSAEFLNVPGKDTLWSMTRQHLYRGMLDAARRAGAEIVTSSMVVGATADGVLMLADGSRARADLVIGADGVRSRVRDSLDLGQTRHRYKDGLIRVLIGRGPLTGGEWDHVIDFWHTKDRTLRILYSPVSEDEIYLALMAPRDDAEASSVPVRPAPWLAYFPQFGPVLTRVGDRGRYDLYETTRLERWSEGHVAILGDAAHAMPPTLGQGACTAICNALGLAVALDEAGSVRDALALWEARERPLTDHTQRRAAEIAAGRILAGGMDWDDVGMRAARHVPTGAVGTEFA